MLDLDRADLEGVLHNCGLTCFVAEVTLALAPKVAWHQYILSFDDFFDALAAAENLAKRDELKKRLLTAFEWPMPSYFVPLAKKGAFPDGASVVFFYTDLDLDGMQAVAAELGGTVTFHEPPNETGRRGTQIYDYTWNHTTQWAMKADPKFTYLQDRFELERVAEQIRARKEKFPELVEHVEFIKVDGEVVAGGLTIVRFESEERLWSLIDYCESDGISVSNPHTYFLDDDNRWYGDAFLQRKKEWDPYNLLNPGHLHALEDGGR